MKRFALLIFVVVLGMTNVVPVLAAEGAPEDTSLHLLSSPLPIELSMAPGTTEKAQIRLKNAGTKTERLKTTLLKFKAEGTDGHATLVERGPEDDYFDWVKFDPEVFTINAGEWKTVTATYTVPTYAAFGYYYAIVFTRENEQWRPAEEQSAGLAGGVATLILLDVKSPNARRSLTDVKLTTDKKWYEYLPANLLVTVTNNGNVHVAPHGNIFIDQGDKHDLAILKVNQGSGNILPNSVRTFQVPWSDGFPLLVDKMENGRQVLDVKTAKPVKALSWDWGKIGSFRIGKFKANLVLVYDDGQRDVPLESSVTFWVFPWKLLLIALVIIALVLTGVYGTGRSIYRRIKNRRKP